MSQSQKLDQAFQLLGRYEEYQLKKAWGLMVLIFGVMDIPVFGGILIYDLVKEMAISSLIAQVIGIIVIFIFVLNLVIPLYVLYKYVSIKRPIKDDWKFLSQYDIRFVLALFLVWISSSFIIWDFLLLLSGIYVFFGIFILPQFYLHGALTLFISYFLVKGVIRSDKFAEHLLLSLVVLVESIIAFIVELLFQPSPLISYLFPGNIMLLFIHSFAYIACGAYQLRLASKMLEAKQ